ncbi:MAG: TRAP transporter substrate-binding protein [Rhodospirillales bacterium]|jgi:TRAP-type C4-dicarboxylate transport system substrate-binding protein|nr:TRAP transporter substrate-binding protein [Rhodospirillales bacterium]MDP6883133.1 TRAP transporter substrate-binding protein [Rhodospirillales bacterium]
MSSRYLGIITAGAVAFLGASTASAADLSKTHVTGVGLNANTVASYKDEVPFWGQTIPKASGGKVTATFAPQDHMGVKGFQVMRMVKLGVVDFGAGDVSKMAQDSPVFEGCDLAGLALDIKTARAVCKAWLPVMSRVAEKLFNTKLLAVGTNPPQVVWCRIPIKGLADLKGKKVRVFNKTMSDFIQAVGGTTISMAFAEVVPALQRGVVDCAVTGTMSGFTAGWPEVSTHQFQVYMGWSINYQSVNLDSWNRMSPDLQKFFLDQFAKFEDKMWETGAAAVAGADNCNFGFGKCTEGKPAKLTKVAVSDADKATHKRLMNEVVLVEWGKRAGKDYAKEWNETVGKVVGLTIPLDKL